ncbi:MAG: hypothetical protein NC218_05870 [Acetobacter sp.]|nr:hypothetical protein [Acetobacter sp.]
MITLIISKSEFIAALIFLTLMAIYGLSSLMLAKHRELSLKVQKMSDAQLLDQFKALSEDYEKKATFWKGQELREILEERKKRRLIKQISDAELMERYHLIQKDNEQAPTYWKKRELAYFREEVEKRRWKGRQI